MKTLDERFWEKVRVGDGCWEWQAALNSKGYGSIGYKGKVWLASRVSALLAGMDIEGKHVCHHCDNPKCVRPGHLFVGTHQDNMRDRDSKGRGAPKDGERNPSAKLTSLQVAEIRRCYADGESQRSIAKRYPVGKSMVHLIVTGSKW